MEKYQFCNTHKQRAEFIRRDIKSNQLKGFCQRCLPLPQGMPYQLINNVINDLKNNKTQMINVFETQKKQNTEIIRKLIDYLKQFKLSQEEKIQKLINQSELEISKIEITYNTSQKQISDASMDVEELIIFYNSLQYDNSLSQTQSKLQEMLYQIQQHQFLFYSHKILNEFPNIIHLDLCDKNKNYFQKFQRCPKHNEIIVEVDLNQQQSKLDYMFCSTCIERRAEKVSMTTLADAEQAWRNHCSNSNITNWLNFKSDFFKQSKIQNKVEALLNVLLIYKNQKLNQQNKFILSLKLNFIDDDVIVHVEHLKKMIKLTDGDWQKFQFQINKLHGLLNQIPILIRIKKLLDSISSISIDQVDEVISKISYDFLQVTIEQKEKCFAIAINSVGNILVAACSNRINVFEFYSNSVKKLQQLNEHTDIVSNLEFMKNKDQFVSASYDKTIIIWTQQYMNNWKATQILKGHTDAILSLTISQNSNQIISGGEFQQIIFWRLSSQGWSNCQTIAEEEMAFGLCLNQSENKLITCGVFQVFIIEYIQTKKWLIIQKIKIKAQLGSRVCFTTDDQFALQICGSGKIDIFEYNILEKQFLIKQKYLNLKEQSIEIRFSFPNEIHYFKGLCISIIKRDENGDFNVYQTIESNNQYSIGTISNSGDYLIYWNAATQKIHITEYSDHALK